MGSEGIVEFRATDPESHWQVFEFRFDRTARSASIFNFDTGSQIMKLPRQNRVTEGFPMHEGSSFSEELSVYLRYLYIHHLIVYFETPEVVHISDIDDCEADDCWDEDEGAFTYDTLNIRMPVDGHNKPCAGFSFIDDSLYSSIYLEVTEVD